MSFDVNVLRPKPIIRETANMNNDGGGGNLGYMQQGQQDEKGKKNRLDVSIFGSKEQDLFISKRELKLTEEKFSIIKWIKKTVRKIIAALKF